MAEEKKAFPEKLMTCWHPVAYSNELTEKTYGTFLLHQAVVVWRDSKGAGSCDARFMHSQRDRLVPGLGQRRLTCLSLPCLGIQ